MNAQDRENKLIWAIEKARDEGSDRPLRWAERVGCVKGANQRRQAFNMAMKGDYEGALARMRE